MNNYVLDFGSFAFENWWQVGLALSAAILYVLYNAFPFVCLTFRIIFKSDQNDYEGALASCALIPIIGVIAGILFWSENETMMRVAALLIFVICVSICGCILHSAGIIN